MYTKEENEDFSRFNSARFFEKKTPLTYEPAYFSIAFVKSKADYTYYRHKHSLFEIIIPENQNYKCILNGTRLELPPGKLLFVHTGDMHQDIFDEGMRFYCLTFRITNSSLLSESCRVFKKTIKPSAQISNIPENKTFTSLCNLLKIEAARDGIFAYYIINGLFQAIFWQIIREFPEKSLTPIFLKSAQDEDLKNSLLDYFERNAYEMINIAEMAKALYMSESSLSHKTKTVLGISPAKAFMRYKMQKAFVLLKERQMSIKEVSELFGFEDQFHFSKTFKRHMGKSPSLL